MTDLLIAALSYAKCDFRVFPVHGIDDGKCTGRSECGTSAGKHPLTQHGFKAAIVDPDTIRAWWSQWPYANVAIATGKQSGLLVVDIDPRNGGDKHLAWLEQRYGQLPQTLTSQTGGGGIHYFFQFEAVH
jgi:hypothetical protein